MAIAKFNHVRVIGLKTVVPARYVDIDDELEYFGGDVNRLAREKKMIGYGRRYVSEPNTTVCDMACDAAEKLFEEMQVDRSEIDLLVFVNQNPDYPGPCDACIAHGVLGLEKDCVTLDINLGCSGWPHALMTAHAMMSSGGFRKGLVLAGDVPTHKCDVDNRKKVQLFGDAASATLLSYNPSDNVPSVFVCGSDGKGWDALISPFGGIRHPITQEVLAYSATDESGNVWRARQSVMKGEDVFAFTLDVAPKLITETISAAGWTTDNVDFVAIHQANRMIHRSIVKKARIDADKAPGDTFTKYANNSTNSVVTVVCDQLHDRPANRVVACAFGVGLSWGAAALDLSEMHNGGIATYVETKEAIKDADVLEHYAKLFRGEA